MRKFCFFIICVISIGISASPITNVIFDTDMGDDVDDVMALDLILKYHEVKKVKLIGVMGNRDAQSCFDFVKMYLSWSGYGKIPVGMVSNGINPVPEENSYATKVLAMESDGKSMFKLKRTVNGNSDAVELYRRLLARAKDNSVVIISVGFSTNLSRLLETCPDRYSILTGIELVKKKVRMISVMAGDFRDGAEAEFNVYNDVRSARKLFTQCPVPLVFSTFDLGVKIHYPAQSIMTDFNWVVNHPFVKSYESFLPMPYDRPTWDLLSTLYAIDPNSDYFTLSESGTVMVTDDGVTTFVPCSNGNSRYLITDVEQNERIKSHLINIISRPFKRYR